RTVRIGYLLPPLSAGGEGSESHNLGHADGANDGWDSGDIYHVRTTDKLDGALQDLSGARYRGDDCGIVSVVAAYAAKHQCRRLTDHARARHRTWDGDAGAGNRGAERCRVPRPRRRDFRGDAISVDWRIFRHRDSGSNLRSSISGESGSFASCWYCSKWSNAQHERAGPAATSGVRAGCVRGSIHRVAWNGISCRHRRMRDWIRPRLASPRKATSSDCCG